MFSANDFLIGSPGYRAYVAGLASIARDAGSRPNRQPVGGASRSSQGATEPAVSEWAEQDVVVGDEPLEDGSVIVTYGDGSRRRRSMEFDPGTERLEERWVDLPPRALPRGE